MDEEHDYGGIDVVELRRRIAFSFSANELRALAADLGLAPVGETKEDLAREILKQAPRYAGLRTLVAKLREKKPLVEWPETPPPPEAEPVLEAETLVDAPPEPAAEATVVDPPPPVSAPAPVAPTVNDAPASARVVPPPSAPRPLWPGTIAPVVTLKPERRFNPQLFLGVAAVVVAVAAVVAFFAGRSSAKPATSEGPAPAHPFAAAAAETLSRGLQNVARVCEVRFGNASEVFSRIRERCGPAAPKRPTASDRPFEDPAPPPIDAPEDPRGSPRPARVADPTSPASSPCMKGCDGEHKGCKSRCGSEPTESSKYGDYQQCLGRCLAAASHCRLGCN